MHQLHKYAAAALTAAALAFVAAPAQANHVAPNMGIDITSVDSSTRSVTGIQHCVPPEQAGQSATFTVVDDIDFGQFQPGMRWGIAVKDGVILSTGEMPCQVSGGPPPGPGGPGGGPGPGGPGMGPGGPGGDTDFMPGFVSRVWKFEVEVDSATATRMSVTIGKVLNLPKKFAGEDDSIVDQDAVVLLSSTTKIYRDGKRVAAAQLEDADSAKVQGKLLPMQKWVKDEDDQQVTTIRAKRIYITG